MCMKLYTLFRSLLYHKNVREFLVQDVLYLQFLHGMCSFSFHQDAVSDKRSNHSLWLSSADGRSPCAGTNTSRQTCSLFAICIGTRVDAMNHTMDLRKFL